MRKWRDYPRFSNTAEKFNYRVSDRIDAPACALTTAKHTRMIYGYTKIRVCEVPTARKIRCVIQASVGPRDREDFPARKRRARAFTSGRCVHNARVHAPSAMRRCVIVFAPYVCVDVYVHAEGCACFHAAGSPRAPLFLSVPFFFLSLRLVTPRLSHLHARTLSPALLFFAEIRGRKNVGDFRARSSAVFHSRRRRRHVIMRQTSGEHRRRSAIFMRDRVNLLGNTQPANHSENYLWSSNDSVCIDHRKYFSLFLRISLYKKRDETLYNHSCNLEIIQDLG